MALVERCRRRGLAAFEELYSAQAGKLFSVACRMVGNPADAEDSAAGNLSLGASKARRVSGGIGAG